MKTDASFPSREEGPVVAVLFWRLGPYHHARLKAAGQRVRLHGVEFCGTDETYAWDCVSGEEGFQRVTIQPRAPRNRGERHSACAALQGELDRIRPDVVLLPGWTFPDALAGLKWCQENHVPAVVMSESTAHDAPRTAWRESIKRRMVQRFSAALVGGQPHADYLKELGMSGDRIFRGYDAVDNAHFEAGAKAARLEATSRRQELGLPERYFLASARFIPKKNLDQLLRAFAMFRERLGKELEDWHLVVLGDGPLRPELERLRDQLHLKGWVAFPGFRQYNELPAYYGLASALIHASRIEPWGLVVNEALASGLPVLVARNCGCAQDLVREGRNGFLLNPHDPAEMANRLFEMASLSRNRRDAMAREGQSRVREWGPDRFAQGLMEAARCALDHPPEPARRTDRWLLKLMLRR